jgi:hypothetical protein
MAQMHNAANVSDTANPAIAKAVIAVLEAVTFAVPNRLITRALIRHEIIVQQYIIDTTKLPYENGSPHSP